MQLPDRPGGEASTESTAPDRPTGTESAQVLEHEHRLASPGLRHQPLAHEVKSLDDPGTLATALPPSEPPTDPTVPGLLPTETAPTDEVTVLDRGDLRERDDDGGGAVAIEGDPIERPLVGVEGEDGRRLVGRWGRPFDDQDGTAKRQPDLLEGRASEDGAVPVGEAEVDARPLPGPEGEAKVTGLGVEMDGGVVGDEERPKDVGDATPATLADPTAVPLVEGEGGVGGGAGVGEVDLELAGEGLGEGGEGATSGEVLVERLADAAVDHEAEVVEEGEDGWGKGARVAADEGAVERHPGAIAGGGLGRCSVGGM